MIAVILVLFCFSVLHYSLSWFAGGDIVIYAFLMLIYCITTTASLIVFDFASPWLRSTILSDYLRHSSWYPMYHKCKLTMMQQKKLVAPRQCIFAVEPHGYQCLAVAMMFAGYGKHTGLVSTFGEEFMSRTRIVSHWIGYAIPIVNILYGLFGVITSFKEHVMTALDNGCNIVVIPSGIDGKRDAVERPWCAGGGVDILRRSDERYGFLALAARYGTLVIPVLVPEEQYSYKAYGPAWVPWFLRPVFGRYLVFPRTARNRVLVGAPIEGRRFHAKSRASIKAFAEEYYEALVALGAANGVKVRLH